MAQEMEVHRLSKDRGKYTVIDPKGKETDYSILQWNLAWHVHLIIGIIMGLAIGWYTA